MVCIPVFHLKDSFEAEELVKLIKKLSKKNSRFEIESMAVRDNAVVVIYHRIGACAVTRPDLKVTADTYLDALKELNPDIYRKIICDGKSAEAQKG